LSNLKKPSSVINWIPGKTKRFSHIHCPLCDYDMVFPMNDNRRPALIFLDIDGVLIELVRPREVSEKIDATLKELFPHVKGSYSGYQQNIVTARYFNQDAVANLDKIIGRIEESGQRPLVVLSSSWRHACWLDEHRRDVYSRYKFSKYLCGKTSLDGQIEEYLSVEAKQGFEFYKAAQEGYGIRLDDRAAAIEFWLQDHGFEPDATNFVVFDDDYVKPLRKFGKRFIETRFLLSYTNAKDAAEVLCSPEDFT
jgi:hypothetical protein